MQSIQAVQSKNIFSSFIVAKWSIFSILICTYILVYFHRMAPGVVSEYLMGAFNTTGTQLGMLSAIYFFVYAFMQIPSGIIADTFGARTSVIWGNLVAGVGSIIFGMSDGFWMACIGRFWVGVGVSVVFVSIMKSNSVWFHERVFAYMSGVTLLIGNLGSVLAAGPLAQLLTVFAWRDVFICIGSFSILLAILGFLIVRNSPEDMGFTPPNVYNCDNEKTISSSWFNNLLSVIKVPEIWPGFWVQFGMVGGLYSFMGLWGIPYLRDVYGASNSFAATHMTIMLLCFAFGAFSFGWLSDRLGKRKPLLCFCVFGYLLCWLVIMYTPWSPGLVGYGVFGFMGLMGSGFVLTFAAAKEVIHPQLSGMAVSIVNTGCFVGTAIMQPLFGYIADRTWDGTMVNKLRVYSVDGYQNGFLLMLLFSFIAIVGALRLQETYGRNICVKVEEVAVFANK